MGYQKNKQGSSSEAKHTERIYGEINMVETEDLKQVPQFTPAIFVGKENWTVSGSDIEARRLANKRRNNV